MGRGRDLARRGGAIGAHSLRHAVLTSETEASALFDIEQSIAEVSSGIGDSCKSFAFPTETIQSGWRDRRSRPGRKQL